MHTLKNGKSISNASLKPADQFCTNDLRTRETIFARVHQQIVSLLKSRIRTRRLSLHRFDLLAFTIIYEAHLRVRFCVNWMRFVAPKRYDVTSSRNIRNSACNLIFLRASTLIKRTIIILARTRSASYFHTYPIVQLPRVLDASCSGMPTRRYVLSRIITPASSTWHEIRRRYVDQNWLDHIAWQRRRADRPRSTYTVKY
jgi:hypothetical protein